MFAAEHHSLHSSQHFPRPIQAAMSYRATLEDDNSSDSEQAQTDHELSPLLRNHSISESASSQTAPSRSFTISTELAPQIVSHIIPGGISAVVKPLLKMRHLSRYSYVYIRISR